MPSDLTAQNWTTMRICCTLTLGGSGRGTGDLCGKAEAVLREALESKHEGRQAQPYAARLRMSAIWVAAHLPPRVGGTPHR
jgi:hypothetical protein